MIDHTDTQTQQLPLETAPAKRGRGRPKTGSALTPAQKQKAYRERHKSNVTDNSEVKLLREKVKALEHALNRITEWCTKEILEKKELQRQLKEAYSVTEPKIETPKAWHIDFKIKGKRKWKTATETAGFLTEANAHKSMEEMKAKHPEDSYRVVYR